MTRGVTFHVANTIGPLLYHKLKGETPEYDSEKGVTGFRFLSLYLCRPMCMTARVSAIIALNVSGVSVH